MGALRERVRAQTTTQRIVLAAMLTGFVAGWDATALYFIYPDIRDGLAGGDETSASWVLSITSVTAAGLLLQAGRIADRFGHQRVYLAGAILYTAGAAAATAAPELWTLVGARAGQAAGMAVMGPAAIAIILSATPPLHHAAAIGRWGLYTAAAGVLGPATVAVVIDAVSWRVMFAMQVPLGVLLVVLALRGAGLDRPDPATVVRLGDSALATLALTLLILPIVEGNDWGWGSARTVACFVAAGLGVAALVVRSHRSPDAAAIPLDLFGRRSFLATALISVSGGALFFAQWLVLLLFLVEVWGFGLIPSALLLTVMPGSMSLLSVAAGRWADRYGHRRVILPGAALYTAALLVFWLGADERRNIPLLLPVLVTAGVAMAAIWPTLSALGNVGIEPRRLGTSSATIQTVQRFGAALGIAIAVALLSRDVPTFDRHLGAVALLPVAGTVTVAFACFVPTGHGDGDGED